MTYLATIGTDFLHEADTLEALLAYLAGIHEHGESLAIWQGPLLVAVVLPDGSLLTIDNGPHAGRATA